MLPKYNSTNTYFEKHLRDCIWTTLAVNAIQKKFTDLHEMDEQIKNPLLIKTLLQ